MSSRRCSICAEDWPNLSSFSRCPSCGEPTWTNDDPSPAGKVEAPRVDLPKPPYEIDRQCRAFRRWLDTVCADDFRRAS